ncbi:MAG: TolC family protein [Candidatus Wallbacteria bacterium]
MYISEKKLKNIAAVSVAFTVLLASSSFSSAKSDATAEVKINKSDYLNKLYQKKIMEKNGRAGNSKPVVSEPSPAVNDFSKAATTESVISSSMQLDSGKTVKNDILSSISTSEVKVTGEKSDCKLIKADLQKCIEIAAEKNPQILDAKYNYDSQKYKLNQAKSGLKPQVNLNGQTAWTDNENTQNGNTVNSHSGSRSANLTYSQVVYDWGKLQDNVKTASKNLEISELNYAKTKLDVYLTVAQNFYNAITTKKLEKVAEDTLKSSILHQELAEANFNVGISPKTDLIRAQANTYEKKLALITAQNNTKKSNLSLLISMGLMENEALALTEDLKYDTFDVNLEKSIAAAVANRTEVKSQQASIDYLKIQLHQVEVEKMPQFSIGSGAGLAFDNGSDSKKKSFSVTGMLSMPIFNGSLTENKIGEIREKIKSEEQKMATLLLNIRYEVTQAYLNLSEAFEKIEVSKKNVESSELSKTLTTEQYKVGLATMIDLLDSEIIYANSMTGLIQAQGSYLSAKCKFRRSIGELEFYK